MGRIHALSREQIQGRKDRAVRFTRDVVGDPDRAAEIEDEDVEAYAERRKLTMANPMQQDQAAWRAGFDAGAAGGQAASCPYPARTAEALAWRSGFIEGKAKASRTNTARKLETTAAQDVIARAKEILEAAYAPSATRGRLVAAIRAAIEVLEGEDDDQAA